MAFLSVEQELALGWVQTKHAKRLLVVSCPCCDTLMANIEDASTRCHMCSWKPGELVSDCRPPKESPPATPDTPTVRKFARCPCGAERSEERDLSTAVVESIVFDKLSNALPTFKTQTTELRACRRCGSLYIPRPVSSPS